MQTADGIAGSTVSIILAASRTLRSTCFFQPSPGDSRAFQEWLRVRILPQASSSLVSGSVAPGRAAQSSRSHGRTSNAIGSGTVSGAADLQKRKQRIQVHSYSTAIDSKPWILHLDDSGEYRNAVSSRRGGIEEHVIGGGSYHTVTAVRERSRWRTGQYTTCMQSRGSSVTEAEAEALAGGGSSTRTSTPTVREDWSPVAEQDKRRDIPRQLSEIAPGRLGDTRAYVRSASPRRIGPDADGAEGCSQAGGRAIDGGLPGDRGSAAAQESPGATLSVAKMTDHDYAGELQEASLHETSAASSSTDAAAGSASPLRPAIATAGTRAAEESAGSPARSKSGDTVWVEPQGQAPLVVAALSIAPVQYRAGKGSCGRCDSVQHCSTPAGALRHCPGTGTARGASKTSTSDSSKSPMPSCTAPTSTSTSSSSSSSSSSSNGGGIGSSDIGSDRVPSGSQASDGRSVIECMPPPPVAPREPRAASTPMRDELSQALPASPMGVVEGDTPMSSSESPPRSRTGSPSTLRGNSTEQAHHSGYVNLPEEAAAAGSTGALARVLGVTMGSKPMRARRALSSPECAPRFDMGAASHEKRIPRRRPRSHTSGRMVVSHAQLPLTGIGGHRGSPGIDEPEMLELPVSPLFYVSGLDAQQLDQINAPESIETLEEVLGLVGLVVVTVRTVSKPESC